MDIMRLAEINEYLESKRDHISNNYYKNGQRIADIRLMMRDTMHFDITLYNHYKHLKAEEKRLKYNWYLLGRLIENNCRVIEHNR